VGEGFPKEQRLRKRRQFLEVQERGSKISADCLLGLVLPNGLQLTRLGLTVSTKVGNAVVRNRIRRYLRELYRKRREELPKGLDLVLIAKSSAKDAGPAQLARAFDRVVSRLGRPSP
jgi:ribonuclease P protein component